MRQLESGAKWTLFLALAMTGCASTSSNDDETFELQPGQTEFHSVFSKSTLNAIDMATYRADRRYLMKLAPRGQAILINHADPRQHRFAQMRLKAVGKTAENSPALFQAMEDAKATHEAQGLTAGMIMPHVTTNGLTTQHEIQITVPTNHVLPSGALGSVATADSFGSVDNTDWDDDGNPISDTAFTEVFGSMKFSLAQASGDTTLADPGVDVNTDSFMSETIAGSNQLLQSYIVSHSLQPSSAATLQTPTVVSPQDLDHDGHIVICLERAWSGGGCDYDNLGMHTLKVPLKGSISVVNGYINAAEISTYAGSGNYPGNIYVTLRDLGGGCTVPENNQSGMSMATFWSSVTLTPADSPTTMSWDLTDPAKWADFGVNCALNSNEEYLTMNLEVPFTVLTTGQTGHLPVMITDAILSRPPTAPDLSFGPPLQIINSCLAEGTEISLGVGAHRKIEDLHIGDKVTSPYAASLTVTNTAVGTESAPIVHITDTRGRELRLTESHPLYVLDRGMVPAKLLKVGDRVQTDDGGSVLINVTRERYVGKVYNLKVGDAQEAAALGTDQTAVFANGFLVGDGHVQSKYEALELTERASSGKRLSKHWRQDYLSAVSRAGQIQAAK
jgi:hypothetical protein